MQVKIEVSEGEAINILSEYFRNRSESGLADRVGAINSVDVTIKRLPEAQKPIDRQMFDALMRDITKHSKEPGGKIACIKALRMAAAKINFDLGLYEAKMITEAFLPPTFTAFTNPQSHHD